MLKLAGEILEEQLANHTADIDAHMSDLFQEALVGQYMLPLPVYSGNTLTLVADTLYAIPCFIARSLTVDRIACEVTTAAAGKIIRLGIYEDDGSIYPGALLLDAGTVTTDATGIKTITISQALTKGWYWLVMVSDGSPTVRTNYWAFSPIGHSAANFSEGGHNTNYRKATVGSSALADPCVSGMSIGTGQAPAMFLRLLSLD